MKRILLSLATLILLSSGLQAQTYTMSNTNYTTCGGTFYDSGGSGSQYTNSESFTMTFTPGTAGQMLQFVFSAFATESSLDHLQIYNGPNTSSPLIDNYSGSTNPGTITASNPTGQLTFVWVSDGSVLYDGWAAAISCVAPPTAYNFTNGSTITTCSGNFFDPEGASNYLDFSGSRTMTFCSGSAQSLKFIFSIFETNENNDNLTIYNGPTTASPLIGTFSTTNSPGTITSSGPCLTFVWTTDGNQASTPGWFASISCVAPPPANNECIAPTTLTVNPTNICTAFASGTVLQATASSQAIGTCFGTADDDVWYSFVATGTTHIVTLQNVAGSTTDMYHAVYSGTCGSLTNIICNDGNQSLISGLTIGNTYYVRVYTYTSTPGQTSTFDICIGTPPPPPTNDECTGAPLVPVNADLACGSVTAGTIYSATASAQANSCGGTDDDDVWYSFVATDASHQISLQNITGSTSDMYFAVYSGTCGTLTSFLCSDAETATVTGLIAGNTYYIRVYTYTSTVGQTSAFNLCIGTIPHTTITACSGTFYDTGGNSDYSASENYVVTYCSNQPGYLMQLDFTVFETESADDVIIYDGPSTNSPVIGTYDGTTSPGTVTGTGGCLTIAFKSDGSVQAKGWKATVSCIAPPAGINMGNLGSITNCSSYFYDSGAGLGNYSNNETYTATFCAANAVDQVILDFSSFSTLAGDILTIYDGPNTSSPILGNYSGTTSPGVIGSSTGCLTLVFVSNASGVSTGWSAIMSCAPPTPCDGSEPFCTGTTYQFPAAVNVPDMGSVGCLGTTPNPAWYYLRVGTAGPISIYMESDYDVDYICWGPFSSLSAACATDLMNNSGISCSYSAAATETASIPNAQVGEIYVLLITNYANLATNIQFSQTGGTGATDCSIVAPPIINNGPLCVGQTLNLTVSSPVAGATYAWTGPHSFSSTTMNPSHTNIQTVDAGIYSLVITVGGVSSLPVTTTVVVNPIPTITCPPTFNVAACNGPIPAGAATLAAFTALGGTASAGSTITSVDGLPTLVGCTETTIRTYTTTLAGCTNTCVQNLTRTVDVTAPVITGTITAAVIAGCTVADKPVAVTTVAALETMGLAISDNCTADASLVVTSSDGAPVGTCPMTITRTYTVTDACGNATTKTQTITIDDNVVPVISGTITAAVIAGCTVADKPAAAATVAALEAMGVAVSDNCTADASLVVTSSDGAPVGTCPMTITRTYTVTDACLNIATKTQTITIDDNVVPVISGTITTAAIAGCTIADKPAAVATVAALEALGVAVSDNCTADASLVVTSSDGAPTGTCPMTIIRTYTVTDACLNITTKTQTITIDDNIAPVISGTITTAAIAGCTIADKPAAVATVAALEALGVAISDNCTADASLVVTSSDGAPVGTCPMTITRTYTVTDACLNATTKTQTITIDDNVVPVISGTITAAVIAGCTVADKPAAAATVAALEALGVAVSDNCTADASLVVTSSDGAPVGTCPMTITRTYTVTDACLNIATKTQTITIDDNVVPVISGTITAAVIAGCTVADKPAAAATVAALEALGVAVSDNCTADASLVVTSSDGAPVGTCPMTITRTYTVTDACLNIATKTQTITIDDNVVPVISGTITTAAIAGCTIADKPAAVATVAALEALGVAVSDNCTPDASLVVTSSDGAPTGTCPMTIIRTYTVTDACLNIATKTQTITIDDNIAPVISGTITTAAIAGCTIADKPAAVATVAALEALGVAISDNCTADASLVVTSSDGAPTGTCPMTIIRTYTVTDACLNATTKTQTITIDDNVVPVISGTITAAVIAGCTVADLPVAASTTAALEALGVAVSDNCTADASLVVTSSDGAPVGTCPMTITRTYTVTDACLNIATKTQTITIDDNVVPVISGTITAAVIAGCTVADKPAAAATVAALEALGVAISDNCTADASLVVTSSDGAPTGTCPMTITRTYTVTDACLNIATKTQTITIDDNVVPVISGTITTAAIAGCTIADKPAAVATVAALEALGVAVSDNCTPDASLVVTSSDGAPTGTCPMTIIRTYTVTDACLNIATKTQTITIDDNVVPVISGTITAAVIAGCTIADLPVAASTTAALEALGVAVSDNCTADASLVVTSSDGAPTGTCPMTIIRTYTVTDACLNATTKTQTITIDDNVVPVISGTITAAVIAGCTVADLPVAASTTAALEALGVAVSDNCTADASLVVTSSDGAPVGTCPMTITRTYTVTDACLNIATKTQTITIDDNIAPVISGTITTAAIAGCTIADKPAAVATVAALEALGVAISDNCTADASLVVTSSDGAPVGTCPMTITRTYTVTDACLNATTKTQTITIGDNIAPVITTCPANQTYCSIPAGTYTIPAIVATDNCAGALTYSYAITGATSSTGTGVNASGAFATGTSAIAWTVTDACGNSSTCNTSVTINETPELILANTTCAANLLTYDVAFTSTAGVITATAGTVAGSTITGIPAGTNITITADNNGCISTMAITAPNCACPPIPQPINPNNPTICVGQATPALTVDPAAAGYHINWYALSSGGVILAGSTNTYTPTDVLPGVYTYYAETVETFTGCLSPRTDITLTINALPTITCPPTFNVAACNGVIPAGAATPAAFTALGGATNATSISYTDGAPSLVGCTETTIRTYTATLNGCTNTCVQNLTRTVDVTAPTANVLPALGPYTCFANIPAANINDVTGETDNCSGTVTVAHVSDGPNPGCTGTIVRTYSLTDACGNTANITQNITISGPTVIIPANGSSTVACVALATLPTPPTVTDICGGTLAVSAGVAGANPACAGTKTWSFTYTNCAGVTYPWIYTYTISAPTVTIPAGGASTVACVANATLPVPPTVTDNCGRTLTVSAGVAGANPACAGTKTWSFTYTDCAGTTFPWVYTYTIAAPIVTMPAGGSSTVACVANATLPVPPTVTDNCGRTLTVSAGVAGANPACAGTKTWSFTYTDCAGVTYPWVYTYTISAPIVTMPAGGASTVACVTNATLPTPPTVNDNCGRALTVSAGVAGANPACAGTKTWSFTYTDCAGATYPWVYTYTISAPVVTMPAGGSSTVSCPALTNTAPTPPTITDNCGNTLTPSAPVISAAPACEGTRTYTYTYTDCQSVAHNWVYTYTVETDDFTMPANAGSTVSCPSATNTAPALPTVTDNCGNTLTPSAPVIGPIPAGSGTRPYTYTYTDCEGNTHNWVYTYTVSASAFTMPAAGASTVNCPNATDAVPTPPTLTDVCCVVMVPTGPVVTAKPGCEGTRTYTWTYTDCASVSYTWNYVYTVDMPDFTMPANAGSTVNCPALTNTAPTAPAVTDFCGNTITPSAPVISAIPACEGTRTYTYTYTDCAGAAHNWVYTYTIETDDFTMPANAGLTVNCPALTNAAPTLPTVTDNCGNTLTPSAPVISAIPTCEGIRTYTYTYTDCEGNAHNWVYTYTVETDDFTMPANAGLTVNCPSLTNTAPTLPTVTDNCGNTLTASAPVISAIPTCEGIRTYTYTFTDCEGNAHNWVYTYTVETDDFTMPANAGLTVNCPSLTNTAPTPPAVSDNCGNTLTPSAPVISAVPTCEGPRTYTYTYTDCEGTAHNWVYTYTVETDDFIMPADAGSTVSCPSATNTAPALPTVTDNCGNTLTPSAPVIGPIPAGSGTRPYTYTYTDCEGNTHNWVYTYTVSASAFTMPAAGASTVNCPNATDAVPTPPTLTDVCCVVMVPTGPVVTAKPGCEGTRTYTWTYTDCASVSYTWNYVYTVDMPDFTMPANAGSTVNCPALTNTAPTAPTVTDFCGNTITPSAPVISAIPACEGTRTYTYTYTDCAGAAHNWVYTYTIETDDFTMPANAGLTVNCPALTNAAPTLPTVTDNCGNTLTPSAPVISAIPACEGTRTYTYTYTDCEGNAHNWVYTYTVETDDFTMPANAGLTVNCPSLTNTAPTLPTVTDNCGNTLTASAPVISAIPTCEGIRTYTYTFSDCEGNAHNWVYTYTVETDDFTMPANAGLTVNCPSLTNTAPTPPTVTDNCGNTLTPSAPVISAVPTCEGPRTYTYTYTDCEGNAHNWVYTYIVETDDFTMPANAGSTVTCPGATNTAPALPTVTDNCGNTLTPSAPVISANTGCEATRTYTYTYTDCEGTAHNWVYTYTILNAAPTITSCPPAQSFCSTPAGTYTIPPISATDDCPGALTYGYAITGATSRTGAGNDASGTFAAGVSTIAWTVTDACGNSSTCNTTVTVSPTPTVTVPANITVCGGTPIATATFTSATPGATFAWSNNNTTIGLASSGNGNTPGFTAANGTNSPITATITVTPSVNMCSGPVATYSITVNPSPTVNVPANITACNNTLVPASVFTSTTPGASFAWTNTNTAIGLGASGTGIITSFTAANTSTAPISATITVTPSANNCTGTASSFTITVNPSPVATVPANVSLCTGATVPTATFTSTTTGTGFTWTNSNASIGLAASGSGNTIASFTASNTGTTPVVSTISVTPTANTCTGTSVSYTITVNPLPQITFPAIPAICVNAPATTLSGATPAGGAYSGAGVMGGSFNPLTAGVGSFVITYSYTNVNGCSNSATQNITVNPQPTVAISPQDPTICLGTSVSLTATGASTYTWSPATGLNPATGNIVSASPLATTNYVVTGTANGCTNTADVTVNVYTNIPISVTPAISDICPGESAIITASGAITYTWSPPATLSSSTGASVTATPATTTVYNVVGSDLGGCTGSTNVVVTINPLANISFLANPKAGCAPLSVDVLFVPAPGIMDGSWLWNFGDNNSTSTDTAANHIYNDNGTFVVALTAQTVDGCNVSAHDTIVVYPVPEAEFIAHPDVITTDNPTVNFIDNSTNTNQWDWNFGDPASDEMNNSSITNPSHNFMTSGEYTVLLTVANEYGCIDTATKVITVHDAFAFWIPNAFSPNEDLVNDYFAPQGIGYKEDTYVMRIFDRWGKTLYYTEDINKGWDGKDYNNGQMQPDGVYTYQITIADETNHNHDYIGAVILLK